MDTLLWILLPVFVAGGTAIFCYSMMQSRIELAVSKEREKMANLETQLKMQEQSLPDKMKAVEEAAHRKAFDQFLLDFRVEERRYVKESKSRFVNRKSMVMQERLFFRNIPLSNWVEHELPLEEGEGVPRLESPSVFSARALNEQQQNRTPRFLAQ